MARNEWRETGNQKRITIKRLPGRDGWARKEWPERNGQEEMVGKG